MNDWPDGDGLTDIDLDPEEGLPIAENALALHAAGSAGAGSAGGVLNVDSETVELVIAARAGSHRAFDLLIERYQRRVLKVAYQYVGNPDDARDVAQEVFIRLYKYLGRMRDENRFTTWIYRLTVNASYDHISARRSRLDSVSMEDSEGRTMEVPDDDAISLERRVEASDLRDRIVATLDQLTPSERTVFVLRDLQGLESSEVATIQGISSITVRRHLSSARRKVRATLAALHPSFARGDED